MRKTSAEVLSHHLRPARSIPWLQSTAWLSRRRRRETSLLEC
jgi:hypothetical protein